MQPLQHRCQVFAEKHLKDLIPEKPLVVDGISEKDLLVQANWLQWLSWLSWLQWYQRASAPPKM